jgi:hypothetical protein
MFRVKGKAAHEKRPWQIVASQTCGHVTKTIRAGRFKDLGHTTGHDHFV